MRLPLYCITVLLIAPVVLFGQTNIKRPDGNILPVPEINQMVTDLMDQADVTGLYLGIVNDNRPVFTKAYGYSNKPAGKQSDTATSLYAASLSKFLFAYLVLQLVDKKLIDLDKPLYTYLPKPLPDYDGYHDLAGDERWKLLTARHCLSHTTGFPNWRQY